MGRGRGAAGDAGARTVHPACLPPTLLALPPFLLVAQPAHACQLQVVPTPPQPCRACRMTDLYPWQAECLSLPGVLQADGPGCNLVFQGKRVSVLWPAQPPAQHVRVRLSNVCRAFSLPPASIHSRVPFFLTRCSPNWIGEEQRRVCAHAASPQA